MWPYRWAPPIVAVYVVIFFVVYAQGALDGRLPEWETTDAEGEVNDVVANAYLDVLADAFIADPKSQRCFGKRSRESMKGFLGESFPTEWPKSSTVDAICSTPVLAQKYLCQQKDVETYLKYIVLMDNIEKIPNTNNCTADDMSGACSPGFFDADGSAHPCCEGFFCPHMLTCMMVCPDGAHCPRAEITDAPEGYGSQHKQDKWCAPYAYKFRSTLGQCGGADMWSIHPHTPFPHVKWDYSGNMFCPGGSYCPNTTADPIPTPPGHHSRTGSTVPSSCPPLVRCAGGTRMPDDNYVGLTLDAVLFVVLALLWQASHVISRISRRMQSRERLAIRWGMVPSYQIVISRSPPRPQELTETYISNDSTSLGPLSFLKSVPFLGRNQEHPVWAEISEYDNDDQDVPIHLPAYDSLDMAHGLGFDGDPRVTIEFYGLTLKLKSCEKVVVQAASGKFRECKLTAVIGPSGAGKTSLLTALAGKAGYGDVTGLVMVNGKEESLEKYKSVMGFVPQDDIMYTDLTVTENLLFSARYRLPKNVGRGMHLRVVDKAIQVLGLEDVRHEVIGNEESRGISGGQRKRVNIGLELVANPLVLFLDEPTSGLDSTSCRRVVSALKRITDMGVTCGAVVHQPSSRVMRMFDDVLLLGNGGRTVYYGPEDAAQAYFLHHNFTFPSNANPADIYLDIIAGLHTRDGHPEYTPEDLFEFWETSEMHAQQMTRPDLDTDMSRRSLAMASDIGLDGKGSRSFEIGGEGFVSRTCSTMLILVYLIMNVVGIVCMLASAGLKRLMGWVDWKKNVGDGSSASGSLFLHERKTPGFLPQFWWCLRRAALQKTRSPFLVFLEYAIFALTGMILGLLADTRDHTSLPAFMSDMVFNIVGVGLLSAVSALRTFGQSRVVFYREAGSGLNKWAHFVAQDTLGNAETLLKAMCYLLLYHSYAQPRAKLRDMYLITVATVYSWTGLAYFLSQILNHGASQLAAAVIVLINAIIARNIEARGLIKFIQSFSITSWSLEAFVIAEARQLVGVWLLERCYSLQDFNYSIENYGLCVFVLFLLGFLVRAVACISMFTVDKDKQL